MPRRYQIRYPRNCCRQITIADVEIVIATFGDATRRMRTGFGRAIIFTAPARPGASQESRGHTDLRALYELPKIPQNQDIRV